MENQLLNHYQPDKDTQSCGLCIKWPKSHSKAEWVEINTELCVIMNRLRRTAEKKLEKMGNLIYEYELERFEAEQPKKKMVAPKKSRRQQEIHQIVEERRAYGENHHLRRKKT